MKKIFFLLIMPICFTGCSSSAFDSLNPYGESASEIEGYGERNNKVLLDNSGGKTSQAANARHALEVLGTYRSTQDPQPYYPVMQPAEVRLMWVPDHLNKSGDLVPAHYYYLKVLDDRWAVQDAFELEKQLGDSSDVSGTPWVYGGGVR